MVASTDRWQVIHGDCLAVMPTLAAGSVDAVVTDPPYALTSNKKGGSGSASVNLESPYGRARVTTGNGSGGFMGQAWDAEIPGVPMWAEALRVAKPGAHLLAFGGTRTFHRLTCAIEDAGWEIRDCLSWLYGSGFPKSHNGPWGGTALKPAWEPVVLARKPLIGTVAANHAAHGTGALNVDGCRIEASGASPSVERRKGKIPPTTPGGIWPTAGDRQVWAEPHPGEEIGRWPANVALDEAAAAMLDEQSGDVGSFLTPGREYAAGMGGTVYGARTPHTTAAHDAPGGASRFFYTAKASRSEREAGLSAFPEGEKRILNGGIPSAVNSDPRGMSGGGDRRARNTHPTVKPVDLMRWLVRLVTPPGGLVLDPFTGSGTTGIAAHLEGCRFLGIEREPAYVEIARARIKAEAAQGTFDLGAPHAP